MTKEEYEEILEEHKSSALPSYSPQNYGIKASSKRVLARYLRAMKPGELDEIFDESPSLPVQSPQQPSSMLFPTETYSGLRRISSGPPTAEELDLDTDRQPIMFWTKSFNPKNMMGQDVPIEKRQRAIRKFQKGRVVSRYKGFASCRICGKRLGSADLALGRFIWPEEAEHYIEEHNVWFPLLDRFVE